MNPFASTRTAIKRALSPILDSIKLRPELLAFLALLLLFNFPGLHTTFLDSATFRPEPFANGGFWRLFTYPFVHVTWYHLLLDGAAFLVIYASLVESSLARRLAFFLSAALGSALIAWFTAPSIHTLGLCGLSGVAHGLTAISALELLALNPRHSTERRIAWLTFALVIGKAALEAATGRMFLTFFHFGLMGTPIAVSHAGGIVGALFAFLAFRYFERPATQAASSIFPRPALASESPA